ncbi:DNA damage-inducible protein 1 [Colletotrichum karsti]|uniref:DNA damage-inducible protein 1 n=1 Tax=Colletotrichum karsti TaxID=1095194 RepID=A0A9P6IFK4_9PEZI|nr:DNA damage-inducible protein 1 [Colletotrichum karsti]KAF9881929.1 DNA damage-inducible protein 1 [Colletotrichum karsti]
MNLYRTLRIRNRETRLARDDSKPYVALQLCKKYRVTFYFSQSLHTTLHTFKHARDPSQQAQPPNMRITLSITNPEIEDQDLLTLEIFPDMPVSTLREAIQAETQIQPTSQHLYHNGRLIQDDSQTMEQMQITDGDMLALHVRDMRGSTGVPDQGRRGQQQRRRPGGQDPELIRLQILGDPNLRAEATRQQPQLAAALEDPQRFAQLFNDSYDREQREREERQREIARLNDDPFDIEAQAKIEEMIRQERVMENLQNAMEHNPEVFGRVHMLYVDVEVNGHRVKALVDSGAQATIMSPACAEACGIMRLVDKRFAGVARGVGTANIIGRVHSAQIKVGTMFLPCSFTVMEGKQVELLLGLDMLKRYQASIDLAKDKLIIQGEEVPFLGEAEIPKESEEALEEEPRLPGPAGTTIGQRSGVVSGPGAASTGAAQQAPAQQGGSVPTTAPPQASGAGFSEEQISQLMALGFPREAAINALQATGGNVELAAGLLFGA